MGVNSGTPWIDADDLAKALCYLIANSSSQGVYNLVSPNPVRQIDLTKAAAKKLGRPAFVPAPAFALKRILGETVNLLLLPSTKVKPKRLQEEAFVFDYPDIASEINQLLG